MRIAACLVSVLLSCSSAAKASDTTTLTPASSPFSGLGASPNQEALSVALFRGSKTAYRCVQMVTDAAVGNAEAVYVECSPVAGKYRVIAVRLGQQTASDGSASGSPPSTYSASAELDQKDYQVLSDLWLGLLQGVRYQPITSAAVDCVEYHFDTWAKAYGFMSGVAICPTGGTRVARAVEIGQLLAKYARATKAQKPEAKARLMAQARALLAESNTPRAASP